MQLWLLPYQLSSTSIAILLIVPVDPVDHYATPAFAVVFETAIPEAFHRFR